jgi:hypothetical protein
MNFELIAKEKLETNRFRQNHHSFRKIFQGMERKQERYRRHHYFDQEYSYLSCKNEIHCEEEILK